MKTFGLVLLFGWVALAAPFRIVLDFYPNPNHVPLVVAREQGLFRETGVEVELVVPSDPSAPAKLVALRGAELGLTPQFNYLLARDGGLPLLAVGALIDGGLGGLLVLEESGIRSLADLRGRKIGYALEPLEPLLWRTMLAQAGLGPRGYTLVYTGLATLPALLSGAVTAIGAFRNYEPIAAELSDFTPRFFPQEEHGVPDTYELLFIVHPQVLRERGEEVRAVLRALAEAVRRTRENPEGAFALFLRAFPELEDELNRRSFALTLPLYADGLRHDDQDRWRAAEEFLWANGLLRRRLPLEELYSSAWLP